MSAPAFLGQMAAGSRARVRAARRARPEGALAEEVRHLPEPPRLRLDASGFDVIAELKLRSPAAGRLGASGGSGANGGALARRVGAYASGGAAAVSVLTEPSRFDGSLAHLAEASRALAPLGVPVMRKDFLVDPYQVLEARSAGAGGVLVIVRMLARAELDALLDCARGQGLFVLLEAFDEADLELVCELAAAHAGSNALLVGVNCRDLTTLAVRRERLTELAPRLPAGVARVAESGIASPADAGMAAAAGYQLALVGSALMASEDPAPLVAALLRAGRAAGGKR
ncbi:MAG: indole-3-glycerol-phosphate synthase TrpC [Gammaproteobacteria bacterium]|nr:indole-3-glycerol-phosphate synthase TrpC [Gammaproteobacteria bacterium]